MQEYEYGIEGLSILLKDIFFNRKRFEKHSFKNNDMFRKNIERCMKKTLKINKLHNCVQIIPNGKEVYYERMFAQLLLLRLGMQ